MVRRVGLLFTQGRFLKGLSAMLLVCCLAFDDNEDTRWGGVFTVGCFSFDIIECEGVESAESLRVAAESLAFLAPFCRTAHTSKYLPKVASCDPSISL